MAKLKTETNTARMKARIEAAFRATNNDHHENPETVFEHGQHYINCTACGAQWSVVDAVPGIDGFDFEIITVGDESCHQMETEEEHGEYGSGDVERPEEE